MTMSNDTTRKYFWTRVWLLFFCICSANGTSTGLQSHFGDTSYAGGIVWKDEIVYITGQVGKSSCFVGAISAATMKFASKQVIEEDTICHSLIYGNDHLLLLGTAPEGGLFTDSRPTGSTKAEIYGVVAPFEFSGDGSKAGIPEGVLFHDDPVQYPRAIVQDPDNNGSLYVASMHSDSKEKNIDALGLEYPNLTNVQPYGKSFFALIEKIQLHDKKQEQHGAVLSKGGWKKEYGVTPEDGVEADVVVSDMLIANKLLFLVGSTAGSGNAFGNNPNNDVVTGFVTTLEPQTGIAKNHKRFAFDNVYNTELQGACVGSKDSNTFFVVGAGGQYSTHLVLHSLLAKNLDKQWELNHPSEKRLRKIKCVVDESNDFVFVAGIVKNGGKFSDELESAGNDDVFVLKVSVQDKEIVWKKQFGTSDNDSFADMVLNDTGGVILYGDTLGDLMAPSEKETEVWVVSVGADGRFPTEPENTPFNTGGNIAIGTPLTENYNFGGKDVDSPALSPSSSAFDGEVQAIFWFVVIVVVILASYLYIQSKRHRMRVTERALVFSYLQAFEPENIDVRTSAAGGWHGTYVGTLAHGKGIKSHSSIANDALFVDYPLGDPTHEAGSPERQFSIGDMDEDDPLGKPYRDDDRELDAVDLRIGSIPEDMEGSEGSDSGPWGKEIV